MRNVALIDRPTIVSIIILNIYQVDILLFLGQGRIIMISCPALPSFGISDDAAVLAHLSGFGKVSYHNRLTPIVLNRVSTMFSCTNRFPYKPVCRRYSQPFCRPSSLQDTISTVRLSWRLRIVIGSDIGALHNDGFSLHRHRLAPGYVAYSIYGSVGTP